MVGREKTGSGQGVWLAGFALLALTACQSIQPVTKGTGGLDNTSFMALWNTYNHCREGSDLAAMQEDVHRLQGAASVAPLGGFTLPLPNSVKRYVAEPPSRLAVDPKAMAASCGVYTGQTALNLGDTAVATHMFQTVVRKHNQTEYAYYVSQARAGLRQIELGLLAAGPEARILRTSSTGSGSNGPTPSSPASR